MTRSKSKADQICSPDSCLNCCPVNVDDPAPQALTRRWIIRGAFAAAAGLVGSLALPGRTRADHFGCRYPEGTGAPYYLDFARLYSSRLPDGSLLDPISIVQQAYCGYKNGSFPGGKVDLGAPYRDPRSGKLHLWDGIWNQNFDGPRGYTNLMIQPLHGKAYRLYADWLAKYVELGGPRMFGAPIDDPHAAGPGTEQNFRGGRTGQAGFFRQRDGVPVYVVQGAIMDRYRQERGTSGRLGAPKSNEYAWRGGARSDFANGSIVYHPGGRVEVLIGASPLPVNGICTLPGQGAPTDIAQKFRDAHAAARELIGAPGKDQNGCVHKWGGVWTQDFFNAAGEQTNLMYQPITDSVYRVYGVLLKSYFSFGGPLGSFGAPLSAVYRWDDYPWFDSTRVDFEGGFLTYHPGRTRIDPAGKGIRRGLIRQNPPPRGLRGEDWNVNILRDGKLPWWNTTKYGSDIVKAIAGWNALGRIAFVQSGNADDADLFFEEIDDCYDYIRLDLDEWAFRWQPGTADTYGRYEDSTGVDVPFRDAPKAAIKLNVCLMDRLREQERIAVIAHEIGHALGLGHSYAGQLMCDNLTCIGSATTPQEIDRQVYYQIYQ